MKIYSVGSVVLFILTALLLCIDSRAARAELSAQGAFVLIKSIPPGESIAAVDKFLGKPAEERTLDQKSGIKVRRWGTPDDSWFMEVLHNGSLVRASRITWSVRSKGEQQTVFAQLTTAGRKFFGRAGKFRGSTEAEWSSFDDKWLVSVKLGDSIEDGVTVLSGIRGDRMESGKYGF